MATSLGTNAVIVIRVHCTDEQKIEFVVVFFLLFFFLFVFLCMSLAPFSLLVTNKVMNDTGDDDDLVFNSPINVI